jgi:mono/diheme cytochrome c family protein
MRTLFALLSAVLLAPASPLWSAADPAGVAFFEQKVRPVLVEHCYGCHSAGAKKLKGNLYLDSKAGWETGGDSGEAVIVPGDPDGSLFIRTIRHLEEDMEMPPKKPKLPEPVIADLVAWVKMGAPDPREGAKAEAKRADKSWWSLQPNKTDPKTAGGIDEFIAAKLAEKGLDFNPPADPRTLIRRMTYDLHGLPPTPEAVEAFVAESIRDPQSAVRDLVDRLLASPRYGEQWGRHWLDVIRFGESNGFERNFIIDDLYPFRDYVIRSFNEDKPFDRFIVEHLAGDVIGKDQPAIEIGSAFLVAGPYDDVGNQDPVAQKNIRAATIDDMVTATSGAFLGLTVNCARCHNHKFDPIPAEDYYRVRAAFEGVTHGRRVVATAEQRKSHAEAMRPLTAKLADLNAKKEALDKKIDTRAKTQFARMKFTRPPVDRFGTDENFPATEAKMLRFVISGFTSDADSKAKPGGPGGRLTEFQVWSSSGKNIALATEGAKAEGAKSATAEDFPEAYGPQYCIDGRLGEAWFIGNPPVLTLTFANPERIERITFINSRAGKEDAEDDSKVRGATPTEYEVQVSMDGTTWQTVASSEGRQPYTEALGIVMARRTVITADEKATLAGLEKQIAEVNAAIARVPKLPEIWAGKFAQSKEKTFLFRGGDPMKPVNEVTAASLDVLDGVTKPYQLSADAPEGERRLALARWIVGTENPLTPRVLANRVWHYHFGTGIVDTPSDFGYLGSKPTHPELLDYLAAKLVANGWKLKALHREILLSRTYRQSSSASSNPGMRVDGASRLLWRFPPRRLAAEEVRDTMLAVTGSLRLDPMGGPGFRLYKFTQNNVSTYFPLEQHGPETYRRAVYHQNARASVVDVLSDFDFPDVAFASPKRASTTTPLQSLTLLNHSFTLDMAEALARRAEGPEAVETAYRILFQREPSANESGAAHALLAKHGLRALCRALLNSNELIYLE